ncbi:MAG: DUF6390 family protein [Actinomycetota bacterium]|nr:DUF6390 family protein [Actinomycetota bacterium]
MASSRRDDGSRLFARYAYSPNKLGYCGPADSAALFELGAQGSTEADVESIAQRFSGAWPYLSILAELAGIEDPLDERVVRAYWTGNSLLRQVDRARFGSVLLETIGAQAGHYWQHLTPALGTEAVATHGFHVFGVYPWTRLLPGELSAQPLSVLDNCRVRWGRMIAWDGDHVIARSRALTWDGRALGLSVPRQERVRVAVDGVSFVPGAKPGDWLAMHWDWVCDVLSPGEVAQLRFWTRWQLEATNRRLIRTTTS